MREDDVRLLCFNDLAEIIVAGGVHFGAGVDLAGEDRAGLENLARLYALRRANGGGFLIGFVLLLESEFAAREVERDDFMPEVCVAGHRSAGGGFGIIGMSARDDYFELGGTRRRG